MEANGTKGSTMLSCKTFVVNSSTRPFGFIIGAAAEDGGKGVDSRHDRGVRILPILARILFTGV